MSSLAATSPSVWQRWFGQTLDAALAGALYALLSAAYLVTFVITALRHQSFRGIVLFVVLLAAAQLAQAAGLYALGDDPPAHLLDGWSKDPGAGLRQLDRTRRARRNLGLGGFSLVAACVLLALAG
jgi:hypothetical protein